jgi:hypothetical protein
MERIGPAQPHAPFGAAPVEREGDPVDLEQGMAAGTPSTRLVALAGTAFRLLARRPIVTPNPAA